MQDRAQLPTPGESAPQLAIDAVGLAKSFGGQHALTGLDLAVPEGSVTALIGPNGSGKTTTVPFRSADHNAYDRPRGSLDRHATYIVAAYLAGAAR